MEAVQTPETSGNFNVTTRRYIREDSKLDGIITCLKELLYNLPGRAAKNGKLC
jgi:hypothetical protein